jgi:hypothetical protein
MSKDTLAFADFLTGLPRDAGYDSVYAAVMASEAGRWFLGEYASRNRHADTQTLVGALACVEAAIRGEATPQTAMSPRVGALSQAPAQPEGAALSQSAAQSATVAPASCRDLIEIEAAINRVEALVAGWTNGPDSHRAVDRIHDIAFALREREFESALCDALDYAAREISAELNSADTAAQRAGAARELLHDLAGRVKDMIEMAIEIQKAQPPAALAVPSAVVEKQAAPSIEAKPAPTVVNVVGTVISSASAPPAGFNTSQMNTDTGATRESASLAASLPDPEATKSAVAAKSDDAEKALVSTRHDGKAEPQHSAPVLRIVRDAADTEIVVTPAMAGSVQARPETTTVVNVVVEGPAYAPPAEQVSLDVSHIPDAEKIATGTAQLGESSGEVSTREALADADMPQQMAAPAAGGGVPETPPPPHQQTELRAATAEFSFDDGAEANSVNEKLPGLDSVAENVARVDAVEIAARPDEEPRVDAEPAHSAFSESQPTMGPDEDPGDLFEPMPLSGAIYALPIETTVLVVAPISPVQMMPRLTLNRPTLTHDSNPVSAQLEAGTDGRPAANRSEDDKGPVIEPLAADFPELVGAADFESLTDASLNEDEAIAAAAREITPSAPNDPLAEIRALSEEELIALFS